MERCTIQQRVEIIKIYYRNLDSVPSTLVSSRVVLKRWASLWRRCGEFWETILAYILNDQIEARTDAATIDELERNIARYHPMYAWKPSQIGFSKS